MGEQLEERGLKQVAEYDVQWWMWKQYSEVFSAPHHLLTRRLTSTSALCLVKLRIPIMFTTLKAKDLPT